MSRPQFALAIVVTSYEFEGRYASTITQVVERSYYQSEAGAHFAAHRFGEGDETVHCRVEKLQPGKVYNHGVDRWEDGLAYQPWYGDGWKGETVDLFDDIPF
jgi:hypothetical protein